jgi:hypothetical protein
MRDNNIAARMAFVLLIVTAISVTLISLLMIAAASVYAAVPSGPSISQVGLDNGTVNPATMIITSGGTIATVLLNATTQNPHWKAYVGNVTGKLVLEDALSYSIYEWNVTVPAGEVYVTRNDSINWPNIICANSTNLATEDAAMNHTLSADDSISNTFTGTTHRGFWTGSVEFIANQCNHTITTYVNGTAQSPTSLFQEIVLWDRTSLVYSTIMENNLVGFNRKVYDFQMIVPERGWEGPVSSTAYYFYVELV